MRRRDIFVPLTLAGAVPADEDFLRAVAEFERHWILVINGLAGCPPNTLKGYDAQCDPARRHLDLREFAAAKRAWRRVVGE